MGVFCGQNFEHEYINVLLNKLLLYVKKFQNNISQFRPGYINFEWNASMLYSTIASLNHSYVTVYN